MENLILKIKEDLKKIIPQKYWPLATRLKGRLFGYWQRSYSQHGEDLILRAIFGPRTKGFYVDIGAHHPCYLSNTHYFYRRGWSGINIDPMPNCMAAFRRIRKRDVNLEYALSDKREDLTLYMFNNRCVNTLSSEYAATLQQDKAIELLAEKRITTKTLAEVLDAHLPVETPIDFLSLDAEMFDLPILKGNNWEKYRPSVILVEAQGFSLSDPDQSEIYQFLVKRGYRLVYIAIGNLFFLLNSSF